MAIKTITVKLKKPTQNKHKQRLNEQREFAACANDCVKRLLNGEKLTSKNVHFNLKSAIKNGAIEGATQAINDYKEKRAKSIPIFKESLGIWINKQNWYTVKRGGKWYIAFTTNDGRNPVPVIEANEIKIYFPFLVKDNIEFRKRIELYRKGTDWYIAIPIQVSCELDFNKKHEQIYRNINIQNYIPIGVDLGLCHIAVVTEPKSGERQFFSGKEVGYIRRKYHCLRRSLGKKRALSTIKQINKKESRWMKDYNRKLAKSIVDFALKFEKPLIKMEKLDNIRNTVKSLKRPDRTIHSWAFYQLKQFIKQRAAKFGIPVVDINPQNTSQRCSSCYHIDRRNRQSGKSRDKFRCVKCGFTCHADLNAAINIALKH